MRAGQGLLGGEYSGVGEERQGGNGGGVGVGGMGYAGGAEEGRPEEGKEA